MQYAVEATENIRTIASLGLEKVYYCLYLDKLKIYKKIVVRHMVFKSLILSINKCLTSFTIAMLYYIEYLIEPDHNQQKHIVM